MDLYDDAYQDPEPITKEVVKATFRRMLLLGIIIGIVLTSCGVLWNWMEKHDLVPQDEVQQQEPTEPGSKPPGWLGI